MISRPIVTVVLAVVGFGLLIVVFGVHLLSSVPGSLSPEEKMQTALKTLTEDQQQVFKDNQFTILLAQQRSVWLKVKRHDVLAVIWTVLGTMLVAGIGVAGTMYLTRKSRPVTRIVTDGPEGTRIVVETPIMRATKEERRLTAFSLVARNLALANGQQIEETRAMLQAIAATARGFSSFAPKHAQMLPTPDPLALPEGQEGMSFVMPSFTDILTNLEPGDDLIFGYTLDTGDPITGTFDRLYSAVLAGATGSGKTSWGRGLIYQSLQCFPGIEYYVLDPHERHQAGLRASLPNTRHFQYLDAHNPVGGFIAFDQRLSARLAGKESDETPLVFICDELKAASKRGYKDAMVKLFDKITEEGRKVNTYLFALTQDTRQKYGLTFRESLESAYAFKMAPSRAKYLLQDPELEHLHKTIKDPGVAMFVPSDGEAALVRVPQCLPQHAQFLQEHSLVDVSPSFPDAKKLLDANEIQCSLRQRLSSEVHIRDLWQAIFPDQVMTESTFETKLKNRRAWTPEEQRRVSAWIQRTDHARSNETV